MGWTPWCPGKRERISRKTMDDRKNIVINLSDIQQKQRKKKQKREEILS